MSIIENSTVRMPQVVNCRRERPLVSRAQGAVSLTVKEVELHPGWEGRLHIHPTDMAVMVTGGAVQMVLGDEIRTVRAGFTMVVPPKTPHKLVNQLWIPARMLVIYPVADLETSFLE